VVGVGTSPDGGLGMPNCSERRQSRSRCLHLQRYDADLRLFRKQPAIKAAHQVEYALSAIFQDEPSFWRDAVSNSLHGQDGETGTMDEIADIDRRPAIE
jgi:hypothetical protein